LCLGIKQMSVLGSQFAPIRWMHDTTCAHALSRLWNIAHDHDKRLKDHLTYDFDLTSALEDASRQSWFFVDKNDMSRETHSLALKVRQSDGVSSHLIGLVLRISRFD
jgi:hypothetical protein